MNRNKKLITLLALALFILFMIPAFLPSDNLQPFSIRTSKSWHHVVGTTYIYSAFLDHRDSKPCVRILAVGPYHEQLTQVQCYMKSISSGHVVKVRSTFHIMDFDSHDMNHSVVFFLCYPTNQLKASHVALGDLRGKRSKWLTINSMKPQNDIRNHTAVCVRPFFGNYPEEPSHLVEFVAYYLIMGVTHFVFYDYQTSESAKRVLKLLAVNEISLEFLPWDIPQALEYSWQFGQIASITDCVYRLASTHEYVVVVDVDEYIVPKQNVTLQTILKSLTDISNHKSASYVFKHNYFCMDYWDHSSGHDLPLSLLTQTKTIRKYLSPLNIRAKSVMRPLAVVLPGIHRIFLTHGEWQSLVVVDPKIATLHHYRKHVCSFWGRFGYETVEDLTAFKYRDALLNSFPVKMWMASNKRGRH